MRVPVVLFACALCACGGTEPSDAPRGRDGARSGPTDPVSRAEHDVGIERCGLMLERIDGPETTPSFARLMRECSGLFASRSCRDALAADTFSREAVHTACRDAYCDSLRPQPAFCTTEVPSDAELLAQMAPFARTVLRRDLRAIMGREGADEIAELMRDLIESQAER